MDSYLGTTTWNVNSSLVVNTASIEAVIAGSSFDGTLNISGGILPRLTINLTDPAEAWTMAGEMNLSGLTPFFETRLAGSAMLMTGELNVTGGRVRIDSDVTFLGSGATPAQVSIGPTSAALRMQGNTILESDVEFSGNGSFVNAASGQMMFHDGVTLDNVGFENHGDFEIGETIGLASVDRFTNTGSWTIDIGGYLAGAEHDLLLVAGATELGGFLNVNITDDPTLNFSPNIGDEFTFLLSGGNISGTFLNDPTSIAGNNLYHWSVLYNPHDVRLQLSDISSVPEPTCGLMLLGFCMLAVYQRRAETALSISSK